MGGEDNSSAAKNKVAAEGAAATPPSKNPKPKDHRCAARVACVAGAGDVLELLLQAVLSVSAYHL